VTQVALLGQFGLLETVLVLVATLAILRQPEEADAPCLEPLDVAFGASDLPVMPRQRKIRQLVFECVAAADRLPVDDAKGAALVFRVAFDAGFAAKRCMQSAGMQRSGMTREAFWIGDAAARLVALRATLRVVVRGMPFVQRARRHAKITLRPRRPRHQQT